MDVLLICLVPAELYVFKYLKLLTIFKVSIWPGRRYLCLWIGIWSDAWHVMDFIYTVSSVLFFIKHSVACNWLKSLMVSVFFWFTIAMQESALWLEIVNTPASALLFLTNEVKMIKMIEIIVILIDVIKSLLTVCGYPKGGTFTTPQSSTEGKTWFEKLMFD